MISARSSNAAYGKKSHVYSVFTMSIEQGSQSLKDRSVLVTGGSGFIGSELTRQFLDAGVK